MFLIYNNILQLTCKESMGKKERVIWGQNTVELTIDNLVHLIFQIGNKYITPH